MKLSKATLLLALLTPSAPALALQLECGEYELVGRYDYDRSILLVSPGSNGELPLFLTGPRVLNAFLPGSAEHYRLKIDVTQKVGDEGGAVTLREVIGLDLPTRATHPVLKFKAHACR